MKKNIIFFSFLWITLFPVILYCSSDRIYVLQKDFMYANTPQFTVTGELPYKDTHIKPIEFSIFAGALTTFMVTQHIIQVNTIWKDKAEFRFIEDKDYAIYSDKVGHAYGAYLTSNVLRDGLITSGVSLQTSKWLGGLLGLSYSTYVEIMDGFGENWGFSPSDFYMDVTGAGLYFLQNYVPFFQNFTPKFMYVPPKWHGCQDRVPSDIFIDNYSSHTFFVSANIHNMLPDNMKDYWPRWLEISVGYAVRNLCSGTEEQCGYAEYYKRDIFGDVKYIIALDYNFSHLAGKYGPPWDWLITQAKYFKLPAPAIEIGKYETRFFLIYPFPFEIGNFKF